MSRQKKNITCMGAPRAHHQFPEYEELKRDSPGGGIRKFFLAVYIIIGSLVTAALIALVVLAPETHCTKLEF